SAMKKLAARDFEDLLQCAMPVFEDLLPAIHNEVVLDLLFELATWHALAKLRLHTTSTLAALKASTKALGKALRKFLSVMCNAYDTRELPREEAARARRAASSKGKGKATSSDRLKKKFNMNTYKTNALGDYPPAIQMFGTSENYST
ncbi:hypothetical protein CPC08DRAFT_618840, partial [Agrocybe pediades]